MFKSFLLIFFILLQIQYAYSKSEIIIIEADTIKSKKQQKGYEAKGNVVFQKDIYKITSDNIIYDDTEKKIFLKSRAKLTDANNNNIFADEAVISKDMSKGEFKNAGIILNNGISIIAPKIEKIDNNNYFMKESDYYFCPNENLNIDLSYDEIIKQIKKEKLQLFSIHSKQSNIDKGKNKIILKHIFVRFLNIPFFYLPYITSSRPFNTRVSGLSSPSIHKNTNYGTYITLPFKFYFFDNLDIKIEPNFYFERNFLLNGNVKYNNSKHFMFDINLQYAFDNNKSKLFKNDFNVTEKDEGGYKNNKIYLNIYSNGLFNDNVFYYTRLNFTNDSYFLKDYFNNYDKILKSNLNIVKILDDNNSGYINFETLVFQRIREERKLNSFNNPYLIPSIYFNRKIDIFSNYKNKIIFNNDFVLLNIFNEKNNGYTNFRYYTDLKYNSIMNNIYYESNLNLYFDTYKIYNYTNISNKNYDKTRLVPEFDFKVEVPINFYKIFIRPKIQYIVGYGNNSDAIDLDSKDSELTINNLFSNNRYSGYNLVENGNRINYGLEAELDTKFGDLNLIVGQGYKDKFDEKYKIMNFENNVSDILSGVYYRYRDIYLNYLLNIDNKNYNFNRQEIVLEGVFNKFLFNSSYVNINKNKEEQLNFYIKYKVNDKISYDFEINDNLKYNKITMFENRLIYEDGCFKVQLSVKKNGYIDSKEKDNISFNFNFRLKNNVL